MKKVLVLGGTGFLGRHLGAAFVAAGAQVSSAARGGPVRVDLTAMEPDELTALLHRISPDVVVNAAGRAWRATQHDMHEANAVAVEKLVDSLAQLPGRPRLVQLGSIHEYGPGTVGAGTGEHHTPAPVTAYGRSKLAGSQAVIDGVRANRLDAVVLRLANVSGPGTHRGSLLGTIAAQLCAAADRRSSEPVELRLAPLRARRDFVDVRDVTDAVLAAAGLPYSYGEQPVVNIGRGVAIPMRELVERMIELSGARVRIVEDPGAGAQRSDVEWQQLDISRARRLLGWHPRRDMDESLRDLLAAELAAGATGASSP
ncbi:NAD-dependent epimerase/dehydratase family protein [Streptomyces cyaneofuscatus]|uniref:NAD-dependent epimerase/dehydratase family protein n=1 Tax=Streptomyces cyaneofuscatus TaxID=66883 RepID=UPI0036C17C25